MGSDHGTGDSLGDPNGLSMCIADAVRDPVVILDGSLRIQAVNEAFALGFSLASAEVTGHHLREVAGGSWDRPELLAALREVSRERRALRGFEVEAVFQEIGARSLRINANPIPESRPDTGLVVTIEDLTEQRRLQHNLLQSQKLEAVGRLAGGIAHDFNNQLAAIIGFSELAIQSIKWDEAVRTHLLEILKAGQSAATLTQQLLAFSRKRRSPPKPININGVILEWEKMLMRILGEKIQFRTSYGTGLHDVVIDAAQMGQIVLNMVVNARDAMPHGGVVKVKTMNTLRRLENKREPGQFRRHPFVMLEITDSGTGISPDALPRIFEPWFTTKEEGRGTGLGLATVKGILDQVGGQIEVESRVDDGTRFSIYLPSNPAEA